MSDDYKIVLVGLTDEQIENLPDSVVGISRTNSVTELAVLYSIADVFVNPTHEDNYPITNLEAIICGTLVITYETGGSQESAEWYGYSVFKGNIDSIVQQINTKVIFNRKADRSMIDRNETTNAYVELINKFRKCV